MTHVAVIPSNERDLGCFIDDDGFVTRMKMEDSLDTDSTRCKGSPGSADSSSMARHSRPPCTITGTGAQWKRPSPIFLKPAWKESSRKP